MYQVDEKGFFGKFGGAYVPEILYKCVTELQQAYKPIIESEEFKKEYRALVDSWSWTACITCCRLVAYARSLYDGVWAGTSGTGGIVCVGGTDCSVGGMKWVGASLLPEVVG